MSNTEWTQCKDALPDVGQRVMTERGEASRYSERDTTSWWCGRTGDFISTTSWCPLETASVGEDPWSNRMSNIEPTEEQWRAANNIADGQYRAVCKIADVAHLLAEREAKLRDHCVRIGVDAGRGERDALRLENDTLRARVAELENSLAACKRTLFDDDKYWRAIEAQHLARIAELETVYESYREARARIAQLEDANGLDEVAHLARISELYRDNEQHLADIKALRARLYCHEDEVMCSVDENSQPPCECTNCRLRRRTAHYDDAKADAPAVRGAPFDEDLTRTEGGEG